MFNKILSFIFLLTLLLITHISYAKEFPIDNEMRVDERIECASKASIKYNIPVDVLLAISSIENGNIDSVIKNKNGTYDYGIMQINSIYIKDLNNKYGLNITKEDFLKRDCFSFEVAAFKLKEHIKFDTGDLLSRLAMYHSKTAKLNEIYKKKLVYHSKYWSDFLKQNNFTLYLYSEHY